MISGELKATLMTLDQHEVREAWDILKARNDVISVQALRNFKVGDSVSFETRREGIITGTVEKVMRKYVRIRTDYGITWKVDPAHLQKVEA